jgi:hypothetical protein
VLFNETLKYPGILADMAIDIETAIDYFLAVFRMQDCLVTYGPHIGFYAVKSKNHLSEVGETQKSIYPSMKNSRKVRLEALGIDDNLESFQTNFPNII